MEEGTLKKFSKSRKWDFVIHVVSRAAIVKMHANLYY